MTCLSHGKPQLRATRPCSCLQHSVAWRGWVSIGLCSASLASVPFWVRSLTPVSIFWSHATLHYSTTFWTAKPQHDCGSHSADAFLSVTILKQLLPLLLLHHERCFSPQSSSTSPQGDRLATIRLSLTLLKPVSIFSTWANITTQRVTCLRSIVCFS